MHGFGEREVARLGHARLVREPDPRSNLEIYAVPLFALVFGAAGLLVGELVLDGEAWPWFIGLVTGLLIGAVVSTRLRRRREAGASASSEEA